MPTCDFVVGCLHSLLEAPCSWPRRRCRDTQHRCETGSGWRPGPREIHSGGARGPYAYASSISTNRAAVRADKVERAHFTRSKARLLREPIKLCLMLIRRLRYALSACHSPLNGRLRCPGEGPIEHGRFPLPANPIERRRYHHADSLPDYTSQPFPSVNACKSNPHRSNKRSDVGS